MNPYELMLMMHPDADEARHREIIDRVKDTIEGRGGSWLSVDEWGRRKLAYEIDHQSEAVYYVLEFDSTADALEEVSRVLRITDGVMRFMPVVRPKAPAAPPAEAAAEARA
jgi:small subunit ribosomal protein S6